MFPHTSSLGIELKLFLLKSTKNKGRFPIESGREVNELFGAFKYLTLVMPMLLGKAPDKSLSESTRTDKDDKQAKIVSLMLPVNLLPLRSKIVRVGRKCGGEASSKTTIGEVEGIQRYPRKVRDIIFHLVRTFDDQSGEAGHSFDIRK